MEEYLEEWVMDMHEGIIRERECMVQGLMFIYHIHARIDHEVGQRHMVPFHVLLACNGSTVAFNW